MNSCVELSLSSSSPRRAEALALRALLSVWPGRGHRGHEDLEDEGTGLCRLQRARRRHQRTEAAAGLPLLQQANGRRRILTCDCHHSLIDLISHKMFVVVAVFSLMSF